MAEIQSNMAWYFKDKSKDYIQMHEIIAPDYGEELLFLEKIKYVLITEDRKLWGLTENGKAAFHRGCFRSEYIAAFYSMISINQTLWSMIIAVIAIIIAIIGIFLK